MQRALDSNYLWMICTIHAGKLTTTARSKHCSFKHVPYALKENRENQFQDFTFTTHCHVIDWRLGTYFKFTGRSRTYLGRKLCTLTTMIDGQDPLWTLNECTVPTTDFQPVNQMLRSQDYKQYSLHISTDTSHACWLSSKFDFSISGAQFIAQWLRCLWKSIWKIWLKCRHQSRCDYRRQRMLPNTNPS